MLSVLVKKRNIVRNSIRYFFVVFSFSFVSFIILSPFLKKAGILSEEVLPQNETVSVEDALPAPLGEKITAFNWDYKGKKYSLDESLYESYYQFYKTRLTFPTVETGYDKAWYELRNEMFVIPIAGDVTVKELAQKIRALGEARKLNENQIVELVSTFVQTIPYDQGKLDRRVSGLDGETEKVTYPYEVLYDNTGVCQDKSYLAYILLRELGFGVSLFLFPDPKDNHMAIGVACPLQYSNYESGYCFVETTSLGNKIGMIPDLIPKSRIATSAIEINTTENNQLSSIEYQPLGNVEILNKTTGKEYTGIIATIGTQKELERLRKAIDGYGQTLLVVNKEIEKQKSELDKMEKKLKSLKKDENYTDYNNLVDDYNKLLSLVKKNIKEYNKQVATNNAAVLRYRTLAKDFYR